MNMLKHKAKELFSNSEIYYIIIMLISLIYMLFIDRAGIADNGDFQRSLIPTFMDYLDNLTREQLYFDFVNTRYKIETALPIILPVYMNTHVLLLNIAKILNVIFYSRTVFELGFLTAVYIVIFLYGMYLVLRALRTKRLWVNILIGFAVTIVMLDRGNTLYFGSLYAEPAAFVSFVLAIGVFMNMLRFKRLTKYNVCMFFISLMFFMGAKVQYGLLSVLFIPLSVLMVRLADRKNIKRLIKLMTSVMIIVSIGVYLIQPPYLDEVTTFDSVFCGVLTGDENADKQALKELGLSEDYYVLAGMDGFLDEYPIDINSEEFRQGFYEKTGKADLVFYYLKHLDRLFKHLDNTARVSFTNLPEYLGNRTESFSMERCSYDKFNLYDIFKRAAVPKNLIFIITFYIAYFVISMYFAFKKNGTNFGLWNVFLAILIVFSGVQFALPTVGNGGIDISKQLYMFNVIFDVLLLNLCGYAVLALEKAIKAVRKKRI